MHPPTPRDLFLGESGTYMGKQPCGPAGYYGEVEEGKFADPSSLRPPDMHSSLSLCHLQLLIRPAIFLVAVGKFPPLGSMPHQHLYNSGNKECCAMLYNDLTSKEFT